MECSIRTHQQRGRLGYLNNDADEMGGCKGQHGGEVLAAGSARGEYVGMKQGGLTGAILGGGVHGRLLVCEKLVGSRPQPGWNFLRVIKPTFNFFYLTVFARGPDG